MRKAALFSYAVLVAAIVAVAGHGAVRPIDAAHSKMTIYVYKQGLFSFFADNHQIDAPIRSGFYDSLKKRVDVTVDAGKMRVLDPKLAANRRVTVQSNTTGPPVLDAAKYPTITFRSTAIERANPKRWTVMGGLTLHGRTHPIVVYVTPSDATHFTGFATIRQTDFGITPIRIAGGSVSVRNDVRVEFEIVLK